MYGHDVQRVREVHHLHVGVLPHVQVILRLDPEHRPVDADVIAVPRDDQVGVLPLARHRAFALRQRRPQVADVLHHLVQQQQPHHTDDRRRDVRSALDPRRQNPGDHQDVGGKKRAVDNQAADE